MLKFPGLVFFILILNFPLSGQQDTLIFKNGDQLIGEVKSMDRGVVLIETDYSDSDFKIKWVDVKEIYSTTRFLISLYEGARINGTLKTLSADKISISADDGDIFEVGLSEIVYLNGLKSKFWDRVDASIDIGLKVTKANKLRQFSIQSALGYLADKWSTDLYYNDLLSSQDSISDTRRKDGGVNYRFYLPRDWYASPELTYLSNTEQALQSRVTAKLSLGKFIVHTNNLYWGVSAGTSLLKEAFTNDAESRNSAEMLLGTEVNLFDIGDLSFLSNLSVYPSLTEKKRFRSDFKIDAKYEFLDDFYIKFNLTLNYDNQPAVVGKETDYVYGISFGWEL